MAGWKPIATAPRETGRPLLLYPFPWPRGSAEKIEALPQPHDNRPPPLLDLGQPAVRRMIKLAKRRGYLPSMSWIRFCRQRSSQSSRSRT